MPPHHSREPTRGLEIVISLCFNLAFIVLVGTGQYLSQVRSLVVLCPACMGFEPGALNEQSLEVGRITLAVVTIYSSFGDCSKWNFFLHNSNL
jgi:hypothetical protein